MKTESIIVEGTLKDVLKLKEMARESQSLLRPEEPTAVKESLITRRPMGQSELFTLAIHFAASLGAHAAFEIIKSIVAKLKARGANLTIVSPDEGDKPTD